MTVTPPDSNRAARCIVAAIFVVALTLRWGYAMALYGAMGADGLMTGDAFGYLKEGQALAEKFAAGGLHGWDWLGADLTWMPLYPWLVAVNVLACGSLAPLTTVLCQGIVDACTCLLIYAMAALIAPRYARASGLLAAFNPTQIVLSGLLLADTLFLFFVALSLLGAMQWLRQSSWRSTLIMVIGLGGGALARVYIAMWSPILIMFLFLTVLVARRVGARVAMQLVMIGVAVVLSIAPILARNVTQHGTWALTPQGGAHLLFWVVPLVNEAKTGTTWAAGSEQMASELRQRFPAQDPNPFVQSRHHAIVGREKLLELGPAAIAKAWILGAVINLGSPAVITAPPVVALPRIGFYDTKGATSSEKIGNFLFRSDNTLFAWILLTGIVGVGVMGLLQIVGLIALFRQPGALAILLLVMMWAGFVLAVNGPIASPKYRLPIEPVLVLLAGAGFCTLRGRSAPHPVCAAADDRYSAS